MVTIKSIQKFNKRTNKEKAPVYVRITKNKKHANINTGIKLPVRHWDKQSGRVTRGESLASRYNVKLSSIETKLQRLVLDLEDLGYFFSAADVKSKYLNKTNDTFIALMYSWIIERRESGELKYGTYLRYMSVYEKLKVYRPNLLVHEFDERFLRKYSTYLKNTLSNGVNTIASNLSCIRSFATHLIRIRILKMDNNPFIRYNIKRQSTSRSFLDPEQLALIEELELPTGSKIDLSRKIFLFCSQTGLRIGDALRLEKSNYADQRIRFHSQKVDTYETLLLTTKANDIITPMIDDNRSNDSYIFDFLNPTLQQFEETALINQKAATALINKNLAIIGKRCNLGHIHSHMARHSLATNALNKGLSFEEIKGILNHRDVKTTQIYAKVLDSMKDAAIRKLE